MENSGVAINTYHLLKFYMPGEPPVVIEAHKRAAMLAKDFW